MSKLTEADEKIICLSRCSEGNYTRCHLKPRELHLCNYLKDVKPMVNDLIASRVKDAVKEKEAEIAKLKAENVVAVKKERERIENEWKQGFEHGIIWAVAEIMRLHKESVIAREVLTSSGIDYKTMKIDKQDLIQIKVIVNGGE
jgi:hypothetical protein